MESMNNDHIKTLTKYHKVFCEINTKKKLRHPPLSSVLHPLLFEYLRYLCLVVSSIF